MITDIDRIDMSEGSDVLAAASTALFLAVRVDRHIFITSDLLFRLDSPAHDELVLTWRAGSQLKASRRLSRMPSIAASCPSRIRPTSATTHPPV